MRAKHALTRRVSQTTADELARRVELEQTRSLQVRAGIDGVRQQVSVQASQRLATGTNIARVAHADKLKGQIRVAETQAKDVRIGQPASIDTRNGVVTGQPTKSASALGRSLR